MFLKKLDAPIGITFDDVLLVPSKSYVEPDHTDVKARFSKNIGLSVPIVSAAMDTVSEAKMAIAIAREGGLGIIHRNMPREAQIEEIRKVKRGEELLVRDVITAGPSQTVEMVWKTMTEQGIGGIPIIDGSKLVGIISRRDVMPIVKTEPNRKIVEFMARDVVTARENIKIDEAIDIMYEHKVERLPIINEKGGLIGIISMKNILGRRQYPNANKKNGSDQLRVAAAVGPFDIERAMALDKAGADAICVDCAHAHNMRVVESARRIKKMVSADVVVGNIATGEACADLVGFADGVKVGVGPGSICTTRIVAGVGVPQLTAIASAVDVAREAGMPVIADGGVRCSGDVAKAIAAGADCVVLGSLLAGTEEAPGRLITIKGRKYKQYRGMGSLGAMVGGECSDRYFQDSRELGRTEFVPEGVEGAIPYRGTVSDTVCQLIGGLRSSMGYCGATTIKEMQEKAHFIRVTPSGMTESHPHDIMITDEAPNYPLSPRQ